MPIENTLFNLPNYSITRRRDLSLRFDPPVGSRELANALSVKYPNVESLKEQMQRAQMEYIQSESQNGNINPVHSLFLTASGDLTPAPTPSNSLSTSGSLTAIWNVTNGLPVEPKKRKAPYNDEKRRKVARVRRNGACAFHRMKKIECTCPTKVASRQQSPNRTTDNPSQQPAVTNVNNAPGLATALNSSDTPDASFPKLPSSSLGGDLPGTNEPSFPGLEEFGIQPIDEYGFWDLTALPPAPNSNSMRRTPDLSRLIAKPYKSSWRTDAFDSGDESWWLAQDT